MTAREHVVDTLCDAARAELLTLLHPTAARDPLAVRRARRLLDLADQAHTATTATAWDGIARRLHLHSGGLRHPTARRLATTVHDDIRTTLTLGATP